MNVQVQLVTQINLGDRGEYRRLAFDCDPHVETVAELVQRIADATDKRYRSPRRIGDSDVIEIRLVMAAREEM